MIKNPIIPEFELGTLIGNLIAMGIILASILTLLYLVWGGIEWITSGGDKAGLEQARNRVTNAFVGLILVVAAWAIFILTSKFLGFPFPKIPIPGLGGSLTACYEDCAKLKDPTARAACVFVCRRQFSK